MKPFESFLASTIFVLACSLSATHADAQEQIGAFHFTSKVDAFDEVDRSFFFQLGPKQDLTIGWKCMSDGLNMVIMHKYLAGDRDDEVMVRYKIDDQPASESEYWSLYNSSRATMVPMSQVRKLTERLKVGSRLLIRVVDPADSDVLEDSFSLDGLTTALNRLSCYRQ
jgi:hypothetical protein